MGHTIETKQVGRYTVRVELDDLGSETPRDWCNVGTFWTAHRKYNSPDKYDGEIWHALADEFGLWESGKLADCGDFGPYDWQREYILNRVEKEAIILPVYLYDHSGVAYRATEGGNPFHCPWDSGQVGFIFAKLADIRKEWKVKRVSPKLRRQVVDILKQEVKTYSHWANGEVYGFRVEDAEGMDVESCWGFIGEPEYCMAEGVDVAEGQIREDRRKRVEKLKELIRARVPLCLRPSILREVCA